MAAPPMRDDDDGVLPEWLNLVPTANDVPGSTGVTVDGEACRTRRGLLAEWARALDFPGYFGHNWDAFADCLTDRAWPEVADPDHPTELLGPLSVAVRHGERLLVDERPDQLTTFLVVLDDVATGRTLLQPGPHWSPDEPRLLLTLLLPAGAAGELSHRLRTAWR